MSTATKERPILFNGEMVRAVLDGRKTQTRRVIKPQPPSIERIRELSGSGYGWMCCDDFGKPDRWRVTGPVWAVRDKLGFTQEIRCPYGAPGDRLWVRETWMPWFDGGELEDDPCGIIRFKSDNSFANAPNN